MPGRLTLLGPAVFAPRVEFQPIHPNPFIVGNPVRGRAMFFGREAEFELVRRRFEHSTRGGLMVFCGERRSGKTSILFQILDGRLGPDFIPVLIDMQSMAVANEIEFLLRISEEIRAALGPEAEAIPLPTFMESSSHSASFQRYVREVLRAHPDKKLILLFDEYELFENKIDAHLLSADVLHILAGLIEHHPVFVVFTGSQHLEQRRQEYWKILGKSLHKMISFLEREDALSLIRQPVEGRVRYEDATVDAVWRLTAGQPFYTQAICQSLVDQLNERRTNDATPETLAAVVDGIINNPLPQMIFLWDGLDRAEKLVLSLLAEQLADGAAFASADEVMRLLRRRKYPLELDHARVATTLEKLFKGEMLLRHDQGNVHGYAFRMDLWRLWIRRQHSVWQVMREEKLEIRSDARRRRTMVAVLAGLALAVVAAAALLLPALGRRPAGPLAGAPADSSAMFALEAVPAAAAILLDGRDAGAGAFRGPLAPRQDHRVKLSAEGYADSEIVFRLAAGDSARRRVALRELQGDLRVETKPSGAAVTVDGRAAGTSPVTMRGLGAGQSHHVEATLAGHGAARQEVRLASGGITPVTLSLEAALGQLVVSTDPAGSDVRVDGRLRGSSPVTVTGLSLGSHTVSALRGGYLQNDTTVQVRAGSQDLRLALAVEPPGTLVVQGDRPAEIWVDGTLVVANVQNSRPRELPPGPHPVRVVFSSGEAIDQTVMVKSRERATYDYTRGTVTRRPQTETP
jgi:PEGA domain-containing protein